ncbi:MAG: hypothetical protein ACT4PY_12060 [Armatimonadota bacterium]
MTPGALLAALILIWIGVLAVLWWIAVRIEQIEERVNFLGPAER